MELPAIYAQRQQFSQMRINELRKRLHAHPHAKALDDLTIFCAGSYGRLEASPHSDLDLFFIYRSSEIELADRRTRELRLFGTLIGMADEMDFPAFSNDGQYLHTVNCRHLLDALGSRQDDAENYFTLRLLMILEGRPLYGDAVYNDILFEVLESYYRDYFDHQSTFEPWFLLNDISRFWKTLLLNYENKRNQRDGDQPAADKDKQKVRNFKLKYSRLTTCFATIIALGTSSKPVTVEDLVDMVRFTPRQRLEFAAERLPSMTKSVAAILSDYSWFLEQTALTEDDLRARFADKKSRQDMFARANSYGDDVYRIIQEVDASSVNKGHGSLMKYLVV